MAVTAEKIVQPKTTIAKAKTVNGFSPETYLFWYSKMLLMRRFEEKAGQFYGNQIRGFCHLYIGQEAVAAGMLTAIRPGDKVITAYRDHAHAIGMGIPSKEVMAELFGRTTGCSKG